jgi:hypothetical protein
VDAAHLEGQVVDVLADGSVEKGLTVSGGHVTLSAPASNTVIGLPYRCVLETLRPKSEATGIARLLSNRVAVQVLASRGLAVGWVDEAGKLTDIEERDVGDGYGPIPLQTDTFSVAIDGSWDESGGAVTLVHEDPFPCVVLAITREVKSGG